MTDQPDLPLRRLPVAKPGQGLGLLEGVRVLDLTTSLAGPYATMLLADFGAEVIKIERPGSGDDSRQWGPPFLDGAALWYLSVNRNKRSVTLDYAVPAGRALLEQLIRRCDVVATNQLPAVRQKLGVDFAAVAALRPGVVYVSITGFGLGGARQSRPCYDLIAEGYSGVMDVTGEPDSEPQKVGTPAADLLAGADAAMACMAALLRGRQDGESRLIDVSLVDSMTRFLTPRLVSYLGSGELPRRSGGRDSVIAVYQPFRTADEPITLGLANDRMWRRFCEAVARPDLANNPDYRTNSQRRVVRAQIISEVQAILLSHPRQHWLDLFEQAGVAAGPINRLDEVTSDPELIGRGLFFRYDNGGLGVPQVGLGIRVNGRSEVLRSPPPELGRDTNAVLAGLLGLDAPALTQLRADSVI